MFSEKVIASQDDMIQYLYRLELYVRGIDLSMLAVLTMNPWFLARSKDTQLLKRLHEFSIATRSSIIRIGFILEHVEQGDDKISDVISCRFVDLLSI